MAPSLILRRLSPVLSLPSIPSYRRACYWKGRSTSALFQATGGAWRTEESRCFSSCSAVDESLVFDFIEAIKNNDEGLAEDKWERIQALDLPPQQRGESGQTNHLQISGGAAEPSVSHPLDLCDPYGQSPAILCAQRNWAAILKNILDAGADPNIKNIFGSSALMCAASKGHLESMEVLLRHTEEVLEGKGRPTVRTQVDLKSRFGQTALFKAVLHKQETAARMLVKFGASKDVENSRGENIMEIAKKNGIDLETF